MATGGFKSSAATDFLEEWKAKREKMRAKLLGDIAAATGAPLGATGATGARQPAGELANNGSPDRGASSGNCLSPYSVARSSSGSALKRPEEDAHLPAAAAAAAPLSSPRKAPPQADQADSAAPEPSGNVAGNDSDKESASPKGKEKKSAGPSARKGKGQIEKRKLREKRRSTGVVSMPSNESLDELDDYDAGEKDRRDEEEDELVQANTVQNEAMTADPTSGRLMDTSRPGWGRRPDDAASVFFQDTCQSGRGQHKSSSAGPGSEEEVGGNGRQRQNRPSRDGGAAGLEKRIEQLEKELLRERQQNAALLKARQDKDDLIGRLREEIDLLNRDLDDIEDENEQLKQENKTLLKVVGQLTR